MVVTLDRGKGFTRGDVLTIRRRVYDVPSGRTVDEAWLTVKAAIADTDANATFQKIITSSDVAGTGQIEASGSDGTAILRFDLSNTNTTAMTADVRYFYDIQIRFDDSDIQTLENGEQVASAEITIDV